MGSVSVILQLQASVWLEVIETDIITIMWATVAQKYSTLSNKLTEISTSSS